MATKRKPVDAKALAKKLIERQLQIFGDDKDYKFAPSELSWLLDVFKTMAEAEAKDIPNPLEDIEDNDLLSIVNGSKTRGIAGR